MSVITRFAPSPTGYLHIGGARTALFNYLYAKNQRGKFLLRIEDTDKNRSTQEATDAILHGMEWLGLKYDQLYYQSQHEKRHVEIANALLSKGAAYYCYTSQEEINWRRQEAQKAGKHYKFYSEWREKSSHSAPKDKNPVIRIKSPASGSIIINDLVQGRVEVNNNQLDDMILLRSDGTPTYMLAVVVDDHDMGITHIIRGDDHLNNAFRQSVIYEAMNWSLPKMAHIPLIHGMDGKKLSKRHGALGIDYYQKEGYLPEAIFNYLLRLGWSHGNEEIISREQAIKWFNLESLGKSPSRLDFDKMRNLNGFYIKNADNNYLLELISSQITLTPNQQFRILQGISGLKIRAKTVKDLIEGSQIYISNHPIKKDEKAIAIVKNFDPKLAKEYINELENVTNWTENTLKETTQYYIQKNELKLGEIAQFVRAQLAGTTISPSVFDVMPIIGKNESLKRLKDY